MDTANCPGRAELEGFVVGTLPDPILARIADHLQHCPACEAALETLDAPSDPLLWGLRRLTNFAADASEADPVPPQLIAAVRSGGPPSGGASAWLSAEAGNRRLGKFGLLEAARAPVRSGTSSARGIPSWAASWPSRSPGPACWPPRMMSSGSSARPAVPRSSRTRGS